jgi:hypothetical protein
MKKNLLAVLAMAGFLVAFTTSARADSVGCATTSNVSGVNASVCFSVTGDVITITSLSVDGSSSIKGISSFDWNTAADYVGPTNSNGTWADSGTDSNQVDGFDLNPWLGEADGSAFGPPPINGVGTYWTLNGDPGSDFVFHLQYTNSNGTGCSAFVSNTSHDNTGLSAPADGCGSTSVPEPGSLALFGTGILGMAGFLRRKFLA